MKTEITALALLTIMAATATAVSTQEEIEHLLEFVRTSNVQFIRNDAHYTGIEAAEHMQKKLDHFRKQITTAEEFINLACSRSLMTGREYQVKLPDGTTTTSSQWLTEELKRYRLKQDGRPT